MVEGDRGVPGPDVPIRKPVAGWIRALRTLGVVAAIALLFCVWFGRCYSDRMIFLPSRDGNWDVAGRRDATIEEVWLTTPDGARTLSWHLRSPSSRATILFFHGNAGNIAHRGGTMLSLGKLGVDVFMVGYHGYGRSEGEPSEAGVYLDADATYAYLVDRCGVPPSKIVVFGESLGGAPAIDLAARRTVGGLVVQSAFTSIGDMARVVLPALAPVAAFAKSDMNNARKIPSVKAPILFIAATHDEIVPRAQTRRLHDAATAPRQWIEFGDCRHNDLFWAHHAAWLKAVGDFLERVAPR